ncbi:MULTISPECIES: PA2779 family protein [Marinobacter]|uniref:PA2779 family protein n=1 Tax=Marinobacter suaedae TaxID=3057675 RepID=A0ABT8W3X1_9GAMM|nr:MULTISPECIES: PA2779 family protein [unclassified Marinobacter]MBZ2167402.1 PA2779 family protein [Marinobacter sp. F4216]MDO3722858.1 PA2779 family protein [Marinobacter sp. chi1]
MSGIRKHLRHISFFMALVLAMGTVWSSAATAAMVGTGEMIHGQQQELDRQQLMDMLDTEEVQNKLLELGVSEDQVRDRIQNLTPTELADFEQQLAEAPAGQDVVGIIVLFLLVFIVTDMLCATNIFSFINCIR